MQRRLQFEVRIIVLGDFVTESEILLKMSENSFTLVLGYLVENQKSLSNKSSYFVSTFRHAFKK